MRLKNSKKNNFIIIASNILIIFLSLFCLVFENKSNSKLNQILNILRTTFILNRFTLNSMINFFSLLCLKNESELACKNYFFQYFQDHDDIRELYSFSKEELKLRLNQYPADYKNLNIY